MTQPVDPFMALTEQQAVSSRELPDNLHVRGAIRVTVSAKGGPQPIGGFPLPPEPREMTTRTDPSS